MGTDWIKMRTDLYRDPKVCVIADLLLSEDGQLSRYVNQNTQRDMSVTRNVMRNVVVGALVSIWGVLRHRGKRIQDDLVLHGCTVAVIDDIADLPGFGSAMLTVGWVEETPEGIVLPRFFEDYNVDPAEEAKSKNAERQRRYRDKHKEENANKSNVTVTSQSNAREEKRREENITTTAPLGFAEFWLAYPVKRGKGAAEKAWKRLRPDLQTVLDAIAIAKRSDQWLKNGGEFIPYPATWLNQRRWEDEEHTGQDSIFAGAAGYGS